jgi:hypothetical protein
MPEDFYLEQAPATSHFELQQALATTWPSLFSGFQEPESQDTYCPSINNHQI